MVNWGPSHLSISGFITKVMEGQDITSREILSLIARLAVATAASYFTVKLLVSALEPNSQMKEDAKKKANQLLTKLGVKTNCTLSEYEMMIASQLVVPEDINTNWCDVAGLETVIQEIQETLILPIKHRMEGISSKLIQPPKGILLHGPPGCGKTLMARAVAQEANCRFINLDVSSLTDKFYGESQKLSSAVFSLAAKIQPCIIFIDEIDSFLRVRSSGDHEATAMMKAQFLQQWDGLATNHSHCVLVMGATNRPNDVDRAILRRMPASFHIPLPGPSQRLEILNLILKEEKVDQNVDIASYARLTESFSGSDLRELCRNAAVYRLKELARKDRLKNSSLDEDGLRPISIADFNQALSKMRESRVYDRNPNCLLRSDLD